ncbi:hypothetical protein GA0070613_4992 [Micromonospora inositola]|uniref:Uncharacterized protein n=2 Tax=Micromonospora inositola TaxID=47865 RepID=A0A1C5JMU3_9ACTN|nr:hypothetical protein GA0070613_4992 [Micromonospora inositola]
MTDRPDDETPDPQEEPTSRRSWDWGGPGSSRGPGPEDMTPEFIDAMATAIGKLPDFSKIVSPALIDGLGRIQAQLADVSKVMEPFLVNLQASLANLPKFTMPDLTGVGEAIDRLRAKLPPNWPLDDPELLENVSSVVQDEGIPLVWVPRKEIVRQVLQAADREERIKVLLANRDDIIQDCRDILATISDADLANQLPLATRVVDAFADGHDEAAHALAVLITETVVSRTIDKKYATVKKIVKIDDWGELSVTELRLKTALAAIGPFYATWFPNQDTPAPTELSRHVTVHQADLSHYTAGNSIVAVMLMTSVLRAIQESNEQP